MILLAVLFPSGDTASLSVISIPVLLQFAAKKFWLLITRLVACTSGRNPRQASVFWSYSITGSPVAAYFSRPSSPKYVATVERVNDITSVMLLLRITAPVAVLRINWPFSKSRYINALSGSGASAATALRPINLLVLFTRVAISVTFFITRGGYFIASKNTAFFWW